MKKIPYGVSDYEKIVKGDYYYVDKTAYLRTVEEAGDYLFFIRPRRFGKTLFLSMMEAYYDVRYRGRFEELFGGTDISKAPTEGRGKYLVLAFSFSGVDPAPEKMEVSFLNHLRSRVHLFLDRNSGVLDKEIGVVRERIDESRSGADILSMVLDLFRGLEQKLLVMIDEYDNFANTLLSTSGEAAYRGLTHGEGFFRSFFNALKTGTGGMGAPVARLFLTGVSPITMDDLTSGYNIGMNVSTDAALNRALGFTREDVGEMVEYYRGFGLLKHDTSFLLELMEQWYGNYIFSRKEAKSLFNSDMVLYFLNQYFKEGGIPEELIDRNVRIDYGKLRHLIIIDKKGERRVNGNFSRLREIVERGEVSGKLKKGFPLEEMEAPENFVSLLFYLGLLTIKGEKEGLPVFRIPNQTVKSLFYDYIVRISQETGLLDVNTGKLESLLHDMAYRGAWEAFFNYLSGKLKESTSIRDFIREEKVVQGFLLAYLGFTDYFIVHSEKELNKGYADIVMEPFLAHYEGIKYSYIIEIKYIKTSDSEKPGERKKKVERLRLEAEAQLNEYTSDEKFRKSIGNTELIKLVLIFCGPELEYSGRLGV